MSVDVTAAPTGADDVEWDLSDLYAGVMDPQLGRDADEALEAAVEFKRRHAGRVRELGPGELAAATAEFERIKALAYRVRLFAEMSFDTDTRDDERSRLYQWAHEREIAIDNELRSFELEWAELDEDEAERLLEAPELDTYRHFLRSQRRFRPYLLSEAEERVSAEKTLTGTRAWERLFSELLSQIRVVVDGVEISIDEAREKLRSLPNRDDRRNVAEAITESLQPNLRTRALVLNTIASDRTIEDRLRGYATWISARNLENDISDSAVEALIDAVVGRYEIAHRHFRLRSRLLGLPRLADYDRFAPISERVPTATWDDARALAIESFTSFSPLAGDIVARFFDERWIDAAPRPGKVPGAYCAMRVPGAHPYILTNFAGTRDAALVLAHELGHGLHAVLSADVGFLNTEVPLTIAETASVFGEALAFDTLLERAREPHERLDLLVARIDNALGTAFGTITWNRFEHAVHTTRRAEGELSVERVNELLEAAAGGFHGDAVETTKGFRTWWSYVPHFVSVPGYMYAYAFGFLLSLSIYRRYREEGDALVEPILDVLRRGATESPEQLVGRLGLDLADPAFWHRGLDAVEALVAEAEALAAGQTSI